MNKLSFGGCEDSPDDTKLLKTDLLLALIYYTGPRKDALFGEIPNITQAPSFSSGLSGNRRPVSQMFLPSSAFPACMCDVHMCAAIWMSLSGHSHGSLSCLSIWGLCSTGTMISEVGNTFIHSGIT